MRESWVDAQFGGAAPGLRQAVALGLKVANDEAAREYSDSKFKKRPVFGTARYYYGLDAVAFALERTLGAQVLVLYGRPYALVGNTLIYPWCYGNSLDLDHKDVPVKNISGFKRDLFAAEAGRRAPWQTRIEFVETAAGLDAVINEGLSEFDEEGDLRALLVAYASNPRAGVLKMVFGDVELLPDGHLDWRNEEEVSVAGVVAGDLSITVGDIEEHLNDRFDSLPEPEVEMGYPDDLDGVGDSDSDRQNIEDQRNDDPDGPDEEDKRSKDAS